MIYNNCQLAIDVSRGVIYVHNKDTGTTVLRICGLNDLKVQTTDKIAHHYWI